MKIIYAIFLLLLCHTLTWMQLNGRLFSVWWENNFWINVLVFSPLCFLIGYNYWVIMTEIFNGYVWPVKLIAYGVNIFVFALCSSYFLCEQFLTIRNIVSLLLVSLILLTQQILPKKHILEYFTSDEHPENDPTKNWWGQDQAFQ